MAQFNFNDYNEIKFNGTDITEVKFNGDTVWTASIPILLDYSDVTGEAPSSGSQIYSTDAQVAISSADAMGVELAMEASFSVGSLSAGLGEEIRWNMDGQVITAYSGTTRTASGANFPIGADIPLSIELRLASTDAREIFITIKSVETGDTATSFWFVISSPCYLTTAMVEYYGYEDDGPEMTAMRDLRSHLKDDHQPMLNRYVEDSIQIINGVKDTEDPEYWFNLIREVVIEVKGYIDNEDYKKAEEVYMDMYLSLKDEFIE